MHETAVKGPRRVRYQCRGPIFVGDAQPAVGDAGPGLFTSVNDLAVLLLLDAVLAENTDQALEEDPESGRFRFADPRQAAIGGQIGGRGATVDDLVDDGEHVRFVERDGARENQAGAVVEPQVDRRLGRQRRARWCGPDGRRAGHLAGRFGRLPAELGEIAVRAAARGEQNDGGTAVVDGFAVVVEAQIIDPRAGDIDRARQQIRCDGDPAVLGQRRFARPGRSDGGICRQLAGRLFAGGRTGLGYGNAVGGRVARLAGHRFGRLLLSRRLLLLSRLLDLRS